MTVLIGLLLLAQPVAEGGPPKERGEFRSSELVELIRLEPSLKLDIRYATENNFMRRRFYDEARAFLQRPAAEAVVRVHRALSKDGLGLVIYDGYRPWNVTKAFWDGTPKKHRNFVANPKKGSKHNRGCAVDLGLFDLRTGAILPMPSEFDEFSPRAYPTYTGGTAEERANRDRLIRAMEAEGFTVNSDEWWHFDYKDWRLYRIGNAKFGEIR